jgi:hypothetical protein
MKKWIQFIIAGLVVIAPGKMFGILPVTIAADPMAEIRWLSGELPQWIKSITLAKQQIDHTREMINLVGHPEKIAGVVMGQIGAVLPESLIADAMPTVTNALALSEAGFELRKSAKALKKDVFDVPERYKVFGKDFVRNRTRYVEMALEHSLRLRVSKAVEDKRAVDKKEFAFQQQTLARLGSASTQTEIELHQANLTASKQRMDLAAERVKQAETELTAFTKQIELADRGKIEQELEMAETVSAELKKCAENTVNVGGELIDSLPATFRF